MEQASHSLSARDQAVINLGRRLRLCDVHWNLPLFKQVKRLLTRAQHQQHPPTQNNRLTTVVEQFLNVRRLNSGHMMCVGFPPVPFPTATRPKLEILTKELDPGGWTGIGS